MKKIIKTAMFAVAVVAAGYGSVKAYDAYMTNGNVLMNDNIEALSSTGEGGGTYYIKCYSSLVPEAGASVVECSSCESQPDQTDATWCFADKCPRRY